MIRSISENLKIQLKDFKPVNNIEFEIKNSFSFTEWYLHLDKIQKDGMIVSESLNLADYLTKADLRISKNSIYAQYGYSFKSVDLIEYFSQFAWHIPYSNLAMEDINN